MPSAVFSTGNRIGRHPVSHPTETAQLTSNRILDALPSEEYERLDLQQVNLTHGQNIYRIDDLIEQVIFPINAMISLVAQLSDGSSVEVGVIGYEGMAGLPTVLNDERALHEAMVQIPGVGMRASAQTIRDEFRRGGALQRLLLHGVQSLLLQLSQTAVCNSQHKLEQRLARWLLMSYDRCVCEELPLTQEFVSMMLGVRRAGVTQAALTLQTEGLIQYQRGHITIRDKEGLEAAACECYQVLKADFDRSFEPKE
jgi:CRP-like cAMP-binding protein